MSSRQDEPNASRRWRPEPEVAPASGGHLAPDVHAPGPMFEPGPQQRRRPDDRTQPMEPLEAERRRAAAPARRRSRATVRRVRRTLRHVDPLSVFKLSLFFYAFAVIAWLIFVAIVFKLIDSTGVFSTIEGFLDDIEVRHPDITLWYVEKWALLIGVILWIVGAFINLLLSFLYNVGADTIGGVEMTFVEKDGPA